MCMIDKLCHAKEALFSFVYHLLECIIYRSMNIMTI